MKNSKLLNILSSFSVEEIRSFEKFIASPFFNTVKNYSLFFKEIIKYYPDFNNADLTSELIYNKLYKNKPFNKQVMWNLNSRLEDLAEEFLEQVALRKNHYKQLELQVSEFAERKLLINFGDNLNKMEKLLEHKNIGYTFLKNKESLEYYKQVYYYLKNNLQKMSESKIKASEHHIIFFLRMTVNGLNDLSVMSKDYNLNFDNNLLLEFAKNIDLKRIIDYTGVKSFEYAYLFEIYYHSLLMLLEPEQTQHLNYVRKLYLKHFSKFTIDEKRTILHWILIYCILQIESKGIKYERIVFKLNEFRLKEGIAFYPEGQLHKAIYFQILSVALSVKKIDWAKNFIRNYTMKLKPEFRKSAEAMAYANLNFQTQKYELVLKDLRNVEYNDIWDKLYVKALLAQTFFELKHYDSLLNHIDTAKHFIKNNRSISALYKINYGNFYNFLGKLVALSERNDPVTLDELSEQIRITSRLDNKNWLLLKVKELEK